MFYYSVGSLAKGDVTHTGAGNEIGTSSELSDHKSSKWKGNFVIIFTVR